MVDLLPAAAFKQVIASSGEDAAVLDIGEQYALMSTDGIMESLVETNPYLAGYFAVIVNINDIAAMGGTPLAMVDVISMEEPDVFYEMIRGMQDGVKKMNVPIVGGHTHPDCTYHALDIAIMGVVDKDAVIFSSQAKPGDDVVMVVDLNGEVPEGLPYVWESTKYCPDEVAQSQIKAAARVGKEHLVHSGKDISNPGVLGTLGMMLESSRKGAVVDLEKIPVPEGYGNFINWLLTYQECAFVYSCPPENSQKIIDIFSEVKCAGAVIGKVDDSLELRIRQNGEEAVLFDFSKDLITGCQSDYKSRRGKKVLGTRRWTSHPRTGFPQCFSTLLPHERQ